MPEPTLLHLESADATPLCGLLWEAPAGAPGVVVIPGYASRKENHREFGGMLSALGMAVLALDVRGHGESAGELDGGALDDVHSAIAVLAARGHERIGLRGSSMGGMLALLAAAGDRRVHAVVSIAAARPDRFADRLGQEWARRLDVVGACAREGVARGFWHATDDETVPWGHTFLLAGASSAPVRLRVAMGGGHETLQHDPAIMAETAEFLQVHLRA